MSGALQSLFKAYDLRGTVPEDLDPQRAYAIGVGFGQFCEQAEPEHRRVVVGRDMRDSSIELGDAFIAGLLSVGAVVTDLGLCSTDLMYFASGRFDCPGAMLTASHNPARYNGMKLCLAGAKPIGEESGLLDIRLLAEKALEHAPEHARPEPGEVEHLDLLDEFAEHVRSFIDPNALAGLSVIADSANGMGGLIAPIVFSRLPVSFELIYGELDGSFPNHPADPIQPENLVDLQAALVKTGCDIGLAFDGDADRVFLVDETGAAVPGSTTTAIVAKSMLERYPGATILYNCICSKAVPELITAMGGTAVRTRVGHSFIKAVMAETGAIFGGEHSGHYYFAQNYRADSGIIAAMFVLEALARSEEPLSELRKPFEPYAASGEINSEVADATKVVALVQEHYAKLGASIDHLDGLTVDLGDWWFNLRPSNTEPLLRLNVEASDAPRCAARVAEVLDLMAAAQS